MLRRTLLPLVIAVALAISCSSDESQPALTESQQHEQVEPADQQDGQAIAQSGAEAAVQEERDDQVGQDEQVGQDAAERESPDTRASQTAESQSEAQAAAEPPQQPALQPALQPPPGAVPAPSFEVESAINYVEHLAGELGPRTSGTEEEVVAASYLAETFRELGYETEIQVFQYTAQVGISRLDLNDGFSTMAYRFPGSGEQRVSAGLVDVPGFGEPADFAAVDVSGAIAVVDRGVIEFRAKAANAESAGAVALIVVNRMERESLGGSFGTYTSAIPVLHIARSAGDELRSRLSSTASIPDAAPLTGESRNVIARKAHGTCRVVVGGHYDTVPAVTGANDNASGTALTLAFAETWSEHPAANDICFVGFGAEELGLHGSAHFVRQLRASSGLDQVTAMLNLDAIGDGRAPYRIVASAELRTIGNAVATSLQVFAGSGSLPTTFGSDHASFASAGIPVVFVFPPGAILHTPADNLENFNHEVFADIARLNHGILSCLLLRAGSPVLPDVACAER